MRAIAPRVAIVLLFAVACLTAAEKRSRGQGKTDETPFTALAHLSAWLSEGNASSAIDAFDPQMQGYGEIQRGIDALTAQTDILCSIDIVTDMAEGDLHKLDLDWFLQVQSKADNGPVERRRERVQIEMRKINDRWKITSMSPLTILAPLRIER